MGMSPFSKRCNHYKNSTTPAPLSAPNPASFNIIQTEQVGNACVILAQYPDCTNYEGKKIMVYNKCTVKEIINSKTLDPHFSLYGRSPVARFKPDNFGWELALIVARLCQ